MHRGERFDALPRFGVLVEGLPADAPVLLHSAERKHRLRKLLLGQAVEKVGLVLAFIDSAHEEPSFPVRVKGSARVVAGREPVEMQTSFAGKAGQHAELYPPVAPDAGIGRAAGAILFSKIIEDDFPVLFRAIDDMVFDAQRFAVFFYLLEALFLVRPEACVAFVLMADRATAPYLHGRAPDVVPLLFEEQRRDR